MLLMVYAFYEVESGKRSLTLQEESETIDMLENYLRVSGPTSRMHSTVTLYKVGHVRQFDCGFCKLNSRGQDVLYNLLQGGRGRASNAVFLTFPTNSADCKSAARVQCS